MSEPNTSVFPFPGIEDSEEVDVDAIFGGGGPASDINPFDPPAVQAERPAAPQEQPQPVAPPAPQVKTQKPAPAVEPVNPISAAIDKQETQAAQTAAKSLFEKPPVFAHKSVKEPIEDASMTFEELRIAKSEDFADLEEGKYVSWSVEYCGIRKEIKDPKSKVTEFQQVRAGFRPALPLLPLPLIQQIISFFRSFMLENEEYEALALIYWDKVEQRFFAHVPKQNVRKEHIEADLRD